MRGAQPYWELAEKRLRKALGDVAWKKMKEIVSQMTEAAAEA
jgi:hypothetical protein